MGGWAASHARILAAKAKSAMALAASKGADALVFMHDVDNGAHADVVAQIEAGFAAYSPTAGLTRPVAVAAAPLATVEAWALGAPDALPKVFDDVAEPPRHPERLWGRPHDPRSDHPKQALRRCVGEDCTREHFALIAERADLDALATRCPTSFAPFLGEARERIGECAERGSGRGSNAPTRSAGRKRGRRAAER